MLADTPSYNLHERCLFSFFMSSCSLHALVCLFCVCLRPRSRSANWLKARKSGERVYRLVDREGHFHQSVGESKAGQRVLSGPRKLQGGEVAFWRWKWLEGMCRFVGRADLFFTAFPAASKMRWNQVLHL